MPAFLDNNKEESADDRVTSCLAVETETSAPGAGMAVQMARERGLSVSFEHQSFDELREAALEELIVEGRLHV